MDAEALELARRALALLCDVLTVSDPERLVATNSELDRAVQAITITLLIECADRAVVENALGRIDTMLTDRLG